MRTVECNEGNAAMTEPKNKALTHEENKAHNQKILDEFYKENAALYEPEPQEAIAKWIKTNTEHRQWYICPKCSYQTPRFKDEWQGLTDEERLRCFDDVDWNKVDWCPDHEQYAKAIEAKLKEKNA
jgi:hypothetical protein